MHWRLLAISLFIAILAAMALVKAILWLGMREQLNYVIPLLPVFYAIIYPILEKADSHKHPAPASLYVSSLPAQKRWSGKLLAIMGGVLASLLAHLALETTAWLTTGQAQAGRPLWQQLDAEMLARWLHGDLVHLGGISQILFLSMEMLVVSIFGGLCVGLLSLNTSTLNGLLTGVIVAMWMGANQFASLYIGLLDWSLRLGPSLGQAWRWHYGLPAGLCLQAFIFAVCSGLGKRMKERAHAGRYSRSIF